MPKIAGSPVAPLLLVSVPPPKNAEIAFATRTARNPKFVLPNSSVAAVGWNVDLEFEKRLAVRAGNDGGEQVLFEQVLRVVAVVPAEPHGHDRLGVAVLVGQPLLLPDAGGGEVAPEVDAGHLLVGEPDRAVVVVVGAPGWPIRVSDRPDAGPTSG